MIDAAQPNALSLLDCEMKCACMLRIHRSFAFFQSFLEDSPLYNKHSVYMSVRGGYFRTFCPPGVLGRVSGEREKEQRE
jgi:hypothetical protein